MSELSGKIGAQIHCVDEDEPVDRTREPPKAQKSSFSPTVEGSKGFNYRDRSSYQPTNSNSIQLPRTVPEKETDDFDASVANRKEANYSPRDTLIETAM